MNSIHKSSVIKNIKLFFFLHKAFFAKIATTIKVGFLLEPENGQVCNFLVRLYDISLSRLYVYYLLRI